MENDLTVKQIYDRIEDIKLQQAVLNDRKADLIEMLTAKFNVDHNNIGSQTHERDGVKIKFTIGKDVNWDQKELNHALDIIKTWGEDPSEYMTISLKVGEKQYNAWPETIKKHFRPARTVKPRKLSVSMQTVH